MITPQKRPVPDMPDGMGPPLLFRSCRTECVPRPVMTYGDWALERDIALRAAKEFAPHHYVSGDPSQVLEPCYIVVSDDPSQVLEPWHIVAMATGAFLFGYIAAWCAS